MHSVQFRQFRRLTFRSVPIQAAAEAELRALEEAEAKQRRTGFPQFSQLPGLQEKLPQIRTALSDLRRRASKLRTSGQRTQVAGRVSAGTKNGTEMETETGTERVGKTGGPGGKGAIEGVEKEGLNQTVGKIELEEVRGETGFRGLVASFGRERNGEGLTSGFRWPGKSTEETKGSGKGFMKGISDRIGGHMGEASDSGGSGQSLTGTSEERLSKQTGESTATVVQRSEADSVERKEEASFTGGVGGASGRLGAAGDETRPLSVPVEQPERRGFLAGVSIPGIFKRPRKAESDADDNTSRPALTKASAVSEDLKSATVMESENDDSVPGESTVAIPKKANASEK